MQLEELKAQRERIVLQRAAVKEQLEGMDKALEQLAFGIKLLESQPQEDLRTETERYADEQAELTRPPLD